MLYVVFIIAAVIIGFDQLIKILVINNLKFNGDIILLNGFLKFTYVENKGAAFGILQEQRWLFIISTILVIIAIIYAVCKKEISSKLLICAAGLIIGGGIGNLIDRIIYGYVVDYIWLSFFPPVCNLADYAITTGCLLFLIYFFFFEKKESKGVNKWQIF